VEKLPQVASTTPKPRKKAQPNLDFFDALREVFKDKVVTKIEWNDPDYYVLMRNGHLTLHKPDGKFYDLIVTDGDMAGTDWVILDVIDVV